MLKIPKILTALKAFTSPPYLDFHKKEKAFAIYYSACPLDVLRSDYMSNWAGSACPLEQIADEN